MVQLETKYTKGFLPENWLEQRLPALEQAATKLKEGNGAGGAFTGWVHLPREYDKEEFARIQQAAEKIRNSAQVLVVVGIGGSYLGARAVVELLGQGENSPKILFAGNSLSTDALLDIINQVKDVDFAVNVISKSGTTTEPAVAFRIFKALLEERYGKDGAKERIFATTDKARGALKGLADKEGYETFVVPDDVGGRFSVLTAVGLLPIAVAGIDIETLMGGAKSAMDTLMVGGATNPAWGYAAARHALYQSGKKVEVLACYEPSFRFFAEWWKQLYGESEGKENKGIFPASVEFTADLHSMGQYIQEGERFLFETVVQFSKPRGTIAIPHDPADSDGLNFLSGQDLLFVAEQALKGVTLAHVDGGVPNLALTLDCREAAQVGALIYFFEYACGLSGYLLEVNPFDQPGVEAYKNNMYALLGKPGYEELKASLCTRM